MAVLRGSLGEIEARIITSALVVLGASGVAAVGLDARTRGPAPRLGLVCALGGVVAATLILVVVWAPEEGPLVPRAAASAAVAAAALGLHSGLIAWARRPAWLIRSAIVLGYLAAAQAVVIIAREGATTPELRALASVCIALILALVLIPIMARAGVPSGPKGSDRPRRGGPQGADAHVGPDRPPDSRRAP